MALRKVLIVTYHFPPSAASGTHRMLGFVQHLPKFGWRSLVVAPPAIPWEPTDEALLGRIPPETALYPVPYPVGLLWKPLRWAAPWGVWVPLAWAGCHRAIRHHRPDAVLTTGPPHHIHLLGRHLRRWTGIPWVVDFRDPWVAGDRTQTPRNASGWEARAEPSVVREADAIIANTPGACSLLCTAYPEHAAKMVSITNGYDPEHFEPNPVPPLAGRTVEIIHPGTIYANRDPSAFLEVVRELETSTVGGKNLRVRFMGDFVVTSQEVEIEDQIRAGGLEGVVSIEGHVPYAQALSSMVRADILLLLDSPGRVAGVPAKLYEYVGAGRPVLALAESDGDVAWVLRESGVPYRIAPPHDPSAIRRALLELLENRTSAAGVGAVKPAPTRFTREHLAAELAQLLDSCLEGHCPGSRGASLLEAAR